MKTVISQERSTGMGATRFTAVLLDGKWVRVSQHPAAKWKGRFHGKNEHHVDVADEAISAGFYRSNSGIESVTASNGMSWNTFQDAYDWAAGTEAPTVCPHCGRPL